MHHTKVKGDIGLAKVIADLTVKGFVPCIPLSEHQPYDLVAVCSDGKVIKVQVKYASLKRSGIVEVRFRRNWSDSRGVHTTSYASYEFDYYAVYCPEKDLVLCIPNQIDCPKAIRFSKTANSQEKGVHWYGEYLILKRESSETIRHTPEMVKT